MKKTMMIMAALAMLMAPTKLAAQNYDEYFVDKTLRVDYIFAGNRDKQIDRKSVV